MTDDLPGMPIVYLKRPGLPFIANGRTARMKTVTIFDPYATEEARAQLGRLWAIGAIYPHRRFYFLTAHPEQATEATAWLRDEALKAITDFEIASGQYNVARDRVRAGALDNVAHGVEVNDQESAEAMLAELMKLDGPLFALYDRARGPIDFFEIKLAAMPGLHFDTIAGTIRGNAGEQVGPDRSKLAEIVIGRRFGRRDKVRREWFDQAERACESAATIFRRQPRPGVL